MSIDFDFGNRTPGTRRIFRLIRQRPGISRVELAREAGLSTGTVTQIVKRLRDDGLADEGQSKSMGLGRNRVGLVAQSASHRILGVSVRSDLVRFGLLDWSGGVHQQRAVAMAKDSDPGAVIDRYLRTLKDQRIQVKAIGLATASFPVSAREAAPRFAQAIEETLGQPVLLLNNGTAAAIAEEWRWLEAPPRQFLLVYFGAGIGGALVHRRSQGLPPVVHPVEIGHIGIDPGGIPCVCGNCGCLERIASPVILGQTLEGKSQDQVAALLGTAEAALVYGLTTAINVLDVADVVLAGLDRGVLERFYGNLNERLKSLTTPEGVAVRPRLSSLGDNSAAYGAALSAADEWGA